ncbi:[protein-PII] uridylyltransferase [Accumulibacter sp.]|uniref:[protein-PII] uridylyltransferase n=1 Tax=Accumulibacter sp. TaxID=2053492 RepID=UPI0025DC579C|nr:[protein-PII] uridylyltransferase [Accumulibacter sp.]MCM8596572.1 [protein-PII] uridylyltransferase [Accumulibacter sp.]MCM8626895.1 [protein-PII] uridylyltransferase [Accumulibacter sp.]MDS4050720.1 [protein-PII] uridylyltransferase [Accumulibacter sp.]
MKTETAARQALIARLRARLRDGQHAISERFLADNDAASLLGARCRLVDAVLGELWSELAIPASLSLVGVGGYGRGELYPASDIDVLILLPQRPDSVLVARLEQLVCMFWDIGLETGHSVRTIEQCVEEVAGDTTVQTALIEARLVAGDPRLFAGFQSILARTLDPPAFYQTKRIEQVDRHQRFSDTAYSLEANCKDGPGGLRDLQLILWVAHAAGFGHSWQDLEARGFITREEKLLLQASEGFLSRLRTHLHLLVGRREDRLLFEYQTSLAERLGFVANETRRASEQLMQEYYRRAKAVTQINAIVLQNIGTALFPSPDSSPQPISADFRKVHEFLDIGDEALFANRPSAILEAFLLLQRLPELKGLSAAAQRSLWRARRLVDDQFCSNPANRARFLELFRNGRALPQLLRQMNDSGVLGRYLPAFGRIVGQMQHDLFHVYTVDQHILQVIRNLNRFAVEEFAHEYPLCSRLISDLGKPWILYLAALFHDIAKGRGGDHSELGGEDARHFCLDHGLDEEDAELVVWLVQQHLLMSRVAQKQDISDPDVVARFARAVGDERHLTALYLLTVADIRGTSPKVWNTWKGQLLEQLFDATRRQLLSNESAFLASGVIARRQREARRRMRYLALPEGAHDRLWSQLDTVYFLRQSAEEIAWHARVLHDQLESGKPVVSVRLNPQAAGLEVLVYTPDQPDLFLRMVGFLSRAGYSIVDARIHTTRHGYALDTFVLLEVGDGAHDREMISYIEHELADRLAGGAPVDVPANGRLSRQVRHFPIEPVVSIQPLVSLESDDSGELFVLTVVAADRPGLLFLIARELAGHRANVHTAKIATLGERVEDTFLISGQVLEDSTGRVRLETDLLRQLQVRVAESPGRPAAVASPC